MEQKNLTLEEKVDLLLKYEKKQRTYNLVRMIFSILIFFFVVILPVIGIIWIGDYLKDSLGLDPARFKESLEKIQTLTEQLPASLL